MTPPSLSSHFSEDGAVEQPALALLQQLGWRHLNLMEEVPGPENPTGRTSFHQTWLPARLTAALAKLNPDLSAEALSLAAAVLVQDRFLSAEALSLAAAVLVQDLFRPSPPIVSFTICCATACGWR